MTYNHEFERERMHGSVSGGYQNDLYENTGSSKWLLISLGIIVALIGSAALFSGEAPSERAAEDGIIQQEERLQPTEPVEETVGDDNSETPVTTTD